MQLSKDFTAEVLIELQVTVSATIASLDRMPQERRTVFALLRKMGEYEEIALSHLPSEGERACFRAIVQGLRREIPEAMRLPPVEFDDDS